MVTLQLHEFGISPEGGIVAPFTNGARVMMKFGQVAPFDTQLCYVYAVHLAVQDFICSLSDHRRDLAPETGEDEDYSEQETEADDEDDGSSLEFREDLQAITH